MVLGGFPPRYRLAVCESFAGLFGEFGDDHIVGLPEQLGEFVERERVFGFERDPLGASEVWGGDDAGALCEISESFGGSLESEPGSRGLERRDGMHFASYFENERIAPLNMFSGVGERETEFANPVGVHGR